MMEEVQKPPVTLNSSSSNQEKAHREAYIRGEQYGGKQEFGD
jgi:hypothetical protein